MLYPIELGVRGVKKIGTPTLDDKGFEVFFRKGVGIAVFVGEKGQSVAFD